METIEIIGALITLAGSIFLVLGSLGLVRMPDLYTRIQAGTKASTLGTILTLFGLGLIHLDWMGKLIILILFVLLTNPISSHILARSAHYIKTPVSKLTKVDKLKDKETEKTSEANHTNPEDEL
ncbi:MAG: monovalent cation/H(+) antiporter subunit G [Bacteroidales bacterium]|nr:monovalent cation/H(+) antiporter subunit G [Bacteroidales bacterium]MCF8326852.1 monovalent cation/H(+) antiporter subunit G [Bacteroidales bacterium]